VPRAYAVDIILPGLLGEFPKELPVGQVKFVYLDADRQITEWVPGVNLPIRPFPGVMNEPKMGDFSRTANDLAIYSSSSFERSAGRSLHRSGFPSPTATLLIKAACMASDKCGGSQVAQPPPHLRSGQPVAFKIAEVRHDVGVDAVPCIVARLSVHLQPSQVFLDALTEWLWKIQAGRSCCTFEALICAAG
jgi:hypothetical protein